MSPRKWQTKALEAIKHLSRAVVVATMGAGKSHFMAMMGREILTKQKVASFMVVVVSTKNVADSVQKAFAGHGVQLKQGHNKPERPTEYAGIVVTYQGLGNLLPFIERWQGMGVTLYSVFDEAHHLTTCNEWGNWSEQLAGLSAKTLALTATAFRGDSNPIAFIHDDAGAPKIHFTYGMAEALAHGVVRELVFEHDDGLASYVLNEQQEEIAISEASGEEVRRVNRIVSNPRHKYLRKVLSKANAKLENLMREDRAAAGLVVCKPGYLGNTRYLHAVASLVKEISGGEVCVVTSDDAASEGKITAFREGGGRWIVSVRMVAEGTDIPRLRVMVLTTVPTTETFFRQLCGRVARVTPGPENKGYVYVPKMPHIMQWIDTIQDEQARAASLREEEGTVENGEGDQESGGFHELDCGFEDGGVTTVHGDTYSVDHINRARALIRETRGMGEHDLVTVLRTMRAVEGPIAISPPLVESLQDRRKEDRRFIVSGIKLWAATRVDAGEKIGDAMKRCWIEFAKSLGVKNLDDLLDSRGQDKIDAAMAWVGERVAKNGR